MSLPIVQHEGRRIKVANSTTSRPRRWWLWACGGCAGVSVMACCGLLAVGLLLRGSRPNARDLYSAAPDPAASNDMSEALIESGVQGASVVVIPIKGSSGQIAIITLDESRGYTGFGAQGADALKTVVGNIVDADRTGNYHIEQLSIDYRDTSGQSSLAFTTTMEQAQAYADDRISRGEFVGNVDFHLMDTLRYYGLDELLQGTPQP